MPGEWQEFTAEKKAQKNAYHRAWRRAHPEQGRAYSRAYRREHYPDILVRDRMTARAYRARRLAGDPVAFRVAQRTAVIKWRTHLWLVAPERLRLENRLARSRRRAAGNLTVAQWEAVQAAYHNRCAYCGKQTILTIDHIIPVAAGGKTELSNIVPACRNCNLVKGVKAPLKAVMAVML